MSVATLMKHNFENVIIMNTSGRKDDVDFTSIDQLLQQLNPPNGWDEKKLNTALTGPIAEFVNLSAERQKRKHGKKLHASFERNESERSLLPSCEGPVICTPTGDPTIKDGSHSAICSLPETIFKDSKVSMCEQRTLLSTLMESSAKLTGSNCLLQSDGIFFSGSKMIEDPQAKFDRRKGSKADRVPTYVQGQTSVPSRIVLENSVKLPYVTPATLVPEHASVPSKAVKNSVKLPCSLAKSPVPNYTSLHPSKAVVKTSVKSPSATSETPVPGQTSIPYSVKFPSATTETPVPKHTSLHPPKVIGKNSGKFTSPTAETPISGPTSKPTNTVLKDTVKFSSATAETQLLKHTSVHPSKAVVKSSVKSPSATNETPGQIFLPTTVDLKDTVKLPSPTTEAQGQIFVPTKCVLKDAVKLPSAAAETPKTGQTSVLTKTVLKNSVTLPSAAVEVQFTKLTPFLDVSSRETSDTHNVSAERPESIKRRLVENKTGSKREGSFIASTICVNNYLKNVTNSQTLASKTNSEKLCTKSASTLPSIATADGNTGVRNSEGPEKTNEDILTDKKNASLVTSPLHAINKRCSQTNSQSYHTSLPCRNTSYVSLEGIHSKDKNKLPAEANSKVCAVIKVDCTSLTVSGTVANVEDLVQKEKSCAKTAPYSNGANAVPDPTSLQNGTKLMSPSNAAESRSVKDLTIQNIGGKPQNGNNTIKSSNTTNLGSESVNLLTPLDVKSSVAEEENNFVSKRESVIKGRDLNLCTLSDSVNQQSISSEISVDTDMLQQILSTALRGKTAINCKDRDLNVCTLSDPVNHQSISSEIPVDTDMLQQILSTAFRGEAPVINSSSSVDFKRTNNLKATDSIVYSSCEKNIDKDNTDTFWETLNEDNMDISSEERNESDFEFLDLAWCYQNLNFKIEEAEVIEVSEIYRKKYGGEESSFETSSTFSKGNTQNSVSTPLQEYEKSKTKAPSVSEDSTKSELLHVIKTPSAISKEIALHSMAGPFVSDFITDSGTRDEANLHNGHISEKNKCFVNELHTPSTNSIGLCPSDAVDIDSRMRTCRKRKVPDVENLQKKKSPSNSHEILSQSLSESEATVKSSTNCLSSLTTDSLREILKKFSDQKCDTPSYPDQCDKKSSNCVPVPSSEEIAIHQNHNVIPLTANQIQTDPSYIENDISSQNSPKIISLKKELNSAATISSFDLCKEKQLEDSAATTKICPSKRQIDDRNTDSVKKCRVDGASNGNESNASSGQNNLKGENFTATERTSLDPRRKTKRNRGIERSTENHELSDNSGKFVSSGNDENVDSSYPRSLQSGSLIADVTTLQDKPFLVCNSGPLSSKSVHSGNISRYNFANSVIGPIAQKSVSNVPFNALPKNSSEAPKHFLSSDSSINCSKLQARNTELCKVPESSLQFTEVNLVPKSIRSSVGNRRYETNEVYLIIIGWNSDWLMQQEKCSTPPPISQKFSPVKKSYSSFEEYYNTYFPLLLLETWQNIYTTWLCKSREFVCKLVDYAEKTEWINVQCETFIEKSSERNIDEASIVLIRFRSLEKSEIRMLGYVHSSSKRHYSAVHDKGHSALAHIKSHPNDLKKLKLKLFVAFKSNAIDKSEMVVIQKLANIKKTLIENDALLATADCKLAQIILNPGREMCVSLPSLNDTIAFSNCVQKITAHILKPNSHLVVVKTASLPQRMWGISKIVSEIRKNRHSKVIIFFKSDVSLLDFASNFVRKKIVILDKTLNSTVPTPLLSHTLESLTFENLPDSRHVSAKRQQVLEDSHIVLAKLANSYFEYIYSLLSCLTFTCCILDDANLCSEAESLFPLLHGVEKFILIGNPATRPTVQCKCALDFHYDISLYHRTLNLCEETHA